MGELSVTLIIHSWRTLEATQIERGSMKLSKTLSGSELILLSSCLKSENKFVPSVAAPSGCKISDLLVFGSKSRR